MPAWAHAASISINDDVRSAAGAAGQWATVEREWHTGDYVTFCLPMELRRAPVDRQHPDRVAILFGPVVLAQDEACCRRPFALAPGSELASALVREAAPLRSGVGVGNPAIQLSGTRREG